MYEKVRFCRIYLLAFFALAIALCLPIQAFAAGAPAAMVHTAAEIVSADTAGIPAYSFSGGWDMMPVIFFALGMTAGTVFGFALSALQQMAVRRKQ